MTRSKRYGRRLSDRDKTKAKVRLGEQFRPQPSSLTKFNVRWTLGSVSTRVQSATFSRPTGPGCTASATTGAGKTSRTGSERWSRAAAARWKVRSSGEVFLGGVCGDLRVNLKVPGARSTPRLQMLNLCASERSANSTPRPHSHTFPLSARVRAKAARGSAPPHSQKWNRPS